MALGFFFFSLPSSAAAVRVVFREFPLFKFPFDSKELEKNIPNPNHVRKKEIRTSAAGSIGGKLRRVGAR
jgi:hypothetical protein